MHQPSNGSFSDTNKKNSKDFFHKPDLNTLNVQKTGAYAVG